MIDQRGSSAGLTLDAPGAAVAERGDERQDRRAGAVDLLAAGRAMPAPPASGGDPPARRAPAELPPAARRRPRASTSAAATGAVAAAGPDRLAAAARRRRSPAPRRRPARAGSSPPAAPSRRCRCPPPATSPAPCSCWRSTAGRPRCCARCSGSAAATAGRRRSRSSSISTSVVSSPNAEPTTTRSRDSGTPACGAGLRGHVGHHVHEQAAAAPLLRPGGVRRVRAFDGAGPTASSAASGKPGIHSPMPSTPRAHGQPCPCAEQQADVVAAERERVAEDVAAGRVHAARSGRSGPESTSTGSAPTLRGIQPCSMATIAKTASVAPPAPSRWPV